MSILEKIIADKRKEVDRQKELVPLDILEKSSYLERKGISLASGLGARSSSGIIAEFKRKSPSAGVMNEEVDPEPIAREYAEAGAAGISILTDRKYFGGTIAAPFKEDSIGKKTVDDTVDKVCNILNKIKE